MKFGGLQKNSLIDYPGKISCVLFTMGCNFYCPYCHNPQLVTPKQKQSVAIINNDTIFTFLEKRKGLLEGVVITGGEPTIQKDVINFCKKIKQIGFPIKLDTNGSNPEIIAKLLQEKLIDYVAMDIKSNLNGYFKLWQQDCITEKIVKSIDIIMSNAPSYEFRTTCVKPFIDYDIIKEIINMIKGVRLFVLQQFHNRNNLLKPFFLKEKERCFSNNELKKFKEIADPFVKRCIIRY